MPLSGETGKITIDQVPPYMATTIIGLAILIKAESLATTLRTKYPGTPDNLPLHVYFLGRKFRSHRHPIRHILDGNFIQEQLLLKSYTVVDPPVTEGVTKEGIEPLEHSLRARSSSFTKNSSGGRDSPDNCDARTR